MPKTKTTLKKGDNLPGRGMSNKNRILEAMRLESFEGLTSDSTRDDAEIAFFKHIIRRAKLGDGDKDSGMLLKWLGDKGWSSMKPTLGNVEFDFPTEGTPTQKAFAIVEAMSNAQIPPDIGQMMIGVIKEATVIESNEDLKERIEKLEEMLSNNG